LVPIVTDVGGVASVVRDGENGYLIPHPAAPHLVAERVLHLLNNENRYHQMRQKVYQVRQLYSYEAVARWWMPIFEQLSS
ncbi:MAG: glycosyltransferase, partial [Anaerolineae bacterium]|nr:glycosyltransferase [Anaerolineae bacterium]